MDDNSSELWLRTDEIEEFIGALEFCAEQAALVSVDVMRWKWLIIALHNALQGACVCALRGADTSGTNVQKDRKRYSIWLRAHTGNVDDNPEQLAPMLELYKRVKNKKILLEPFRLKTHDKMNKDVRRLNENRNQFIHFLPASFCLEVSGMPRIVQHCCDAIEHLAIRHPTGWALKEKRYQTRIAEALAMLRRMF